MGGPGRNDRIVKRQGHLLGAFGAQVNRKRRHPGLVVHHFDASDNRLLGGDVFGEGEGEVEPVEAQAAEDAGDEEGGDQQGEQQKEEVIGGKKGRQTHQDND